MVGLIAGSAVWLGFRLFGPVTALAVPVGVALLSWSGYAALLTAIVAKLARSVRPSTLDLVFAALWGGLAAAALARLLALATRDAIAHALGSSREAWISALAAPLPEEAFKAIGVALLLAARPALRSPLCGMVLGAIVGIAFNAAEGLAYSVTEIVRSGSLEPLWSDLLVRGLLTGLVTHSGLTAMVGAGIGYLFGAEEGTRVRRVGVLVATLFLAAALHALINSPLLDDWGVGGVIVKELPVVVATVFVGDRSRSEEVRRQRTRRIPPAHKD